MIRAGVPPTNPFFSETGVPDGVAYYYLWHFSAAVIAVMTGVERLGGRRGAHLVHRLCVPPDDDRPRRAAQRQNDGGIDRGRAGRGRLGPRPAGMDRAGRDRCLPGQGVGVWAAGCSRWPGRPSTWHRPPAWCSPALLLARLARSRRTGSRRRSWVSLRRPASNARSGSAASPSRSAPRRSRSIFCGRVAPEQAPGLRAAGCRRRGGGARDQLSLHSRPARRRRVAGRRSSDRD